MAGHGNVIGTPRTYWTYVDPTTKKPVSSDTPPSPSGGVFGIGASAPAAIKHVETQYEDGTIVDSATGPDGQPQETVRVNPQIAAQYRQSASRAPSPTAQQNADANTTRAGASQQRADAETAKADASQQRADVSQQNANTRSTYDQVRESVLQGQLTRQNYQTETQAYLQKLQSALQLHQIDQTEYENQWRQYQSGIKDGLDALRVGTDMTNAATAQGNLGVSRGNLGVAQQNADTAREVAVHTAEQDAISNTFKLLDRYIPLNGGANDGFLKNYTDSLNRQSGSNYQPSDFLSAPPDLQGVSQRAAAAAVAWMKGQPAPATSAAINATAPPSSVPDPAAAQSAIANAGPRPAPPPPGAAASILSQIGPPPADPNLQKTPVQPYLGPPNPAPWGANGAGNS